MAVVYHTVTDYFNARKGKGNEQGIKKGMAAEDVNREYVAQEMQRLLDNGLELSSPVQQEYFEKLFSEFSATYEDSDSNFWGNGKAGKMGEMEFACLAIAFSDLNTMRDNGQMDMDTYMSYVEQLFDPKVINGLMNSDNGPAASGDFLLLVGNIKTEKDARLNSQYDNSGALLYPVRPIVNQTYDYGYHHQTRDAADGTYSSRMDMTNAHQNMDDIAETVSRWAAEGLLPEGVDAAELQKFVNYNLYDVCTGGVMSTGEYNGKEYGFSPAALGSLAYALQDIDAIQDPDVKAAMIAGIASPEAMIGIVNDEPSGIEFLNTLEMAVISPGQFAADFHAYDVGNEPVNPDPAPSVPATGGHANNGAIYSGYDDDYYERAGRREDGYDFDAIIQENDLLILSQSAPSERFADIQAAALEYYNNPTQDASCMFQDRFSEEEIKQITDMAAHGRRSIENMTAESWAMNYYGRSVDGLDYDFRKQQAEAAARIMTHEDPTDLAVQVNHQRVAEAEGHPVNTPDGRGLSMTQAKEIYAQAAALVAQFYGEREQDHENGFQSVLGGLDATTLGEAIVNAEIETGQDINGSGGVDEHWKEDDYQDDGQYNPDFGFGD